MTITIEIGSWAAKYTKTGIFTLEMHHGATIEDIIAALNLPQDLTGVCSVANKIVTKGHVLHEGDLVKIFPNIVGG